MKRALKFFSMLFFIATISFVILTTTQLVASGMTEQEMVERDTELVTVPSVAIGSFPVATKSVYGNIITWESDNENIIFMDGWFVVKRQVDVDINATITVTVTRPNNPEISAEETFDILVPKGITVRNEYSITYHNVEDTTGFKTSYLLGDETYELPTPTKDGFLFDGWYTTDTFEETTKIEKIVVGSKTNFELYAKWKVAYAEYKVVHRFEQLDSSFEETLIETKEGLIGSEVSTDTPTYPGFQLEEASSMTSGIVREDGQLKLVVVYLRKTFTLTVVNGTEETNIPVKFGAPIELEDPVKAGYDFKGWENIVETMPANDLTVTAKWEAIDVDYTVEFYFEALDGSFVLDATKTQALQAKTDSSVTAPTPAFAGFTFKNDHPDQVLSAVVEGDESTVLKVFYTRNTYTLTVFLDDHGMNDYELDLKYGQPIVLETPTRVGYDFNGWWNEVATMPAEDHRMAAMWTPALVDYQIQYYLETLTGEFVENVNERVQSKELTEEYIYATIKTFTGFTFDESNPKNKVEGEVLPDGSLVLKVYYTRNTYTLTVKYDNGDPDLVKTYKYGETISVVEPVKADYTFAGWEPALPSTMPANDLIVTAQWSALPVYVVTFETQGGTTVQQQNVIEGKTVIVPTSPTKIGYTFVGWFLNPTDETP